jgi:heme A synthase
MLGQLMLGVLLAFAGVPPAVQVLHVGLSSILVATEFFFLLATRVPRGEFKLA